MNKKINTLLFILCATLFNVIIAIISFIVFSIFYVNVIRDAIPEAGRYWAYILIFISAIAVSFMVYRLVLRHLLTKVDVEKYFDPLFVKRNIKKY